MTETLVRALTSLATSPLVPELRLHLARDSHAIWQDTETAAVHEHAKRPYWAFVWPGGQALARWILDNPASVRGKRVLDIGCGSGITALAAAKAGALLVTVNDIDPLAMLATRLNADANGITFGYEPGDLLGMLPVDIDVVLICDVVYEPELATRVAGFIEAAARAGVTVLFGDRGTTRLPVRPLEKLAEYQASAVPAMQGLHFERGIVWRLA